MFKSFHTYIAITSLGVGSLFASDATELDKGELDALQIDQIASNGSATKNQKGVKKSQPTCASPLEQPPQCAPVVLLPSQPCPDNWRLSGAFLYLLPTVDDTYFVIDSGTATRDTSGISGTRKNNDFGFNPAFRVGAEYAWCDMHREVQASYSHLVATQDRTVSGTDLWATMGPSEMVNHFEDYIGTASSSLRLLYQDVEMSFSQQILNSRELYIYLQPGLEYAYLRLAEKHQYQSGIRHVGELNQKSKMWGVGPQIGLGLDYNIYQGAFTCSTTQAFSVTSLFSGSILMGRGKTQTFVPPHPNDLTFVEWLPVNVADEHTGRIIPAFHARVALNYLVQTSSVGVSLAVGYEFNTYVRALSRAIFADDVGDSQCLTNYYNFDVQGLSVSAALSF